MNLLNYFETGRFGKNVYISSLTILKYQGVIYLIFSGNSETDVSKFLENLTEM